MKPSNKFRNGNFLVVIWVTILFTVAMNVTSGYGQFSPANFDGAPVLEPGQMETSLLVTGNYVSDDGETFVKGIIPGIKLGFGIAKYFDLKLAYSRGVYKYKFYDWTDWEDSKVNNLSISPKASFLDGLLAIKMPLTLIMYHNDYKDKIEINYLISPRVILSLHVKQYVEINISPFFELFVPGEGDDPSYFVGGNLGFAFSSDLHRWAIRPEAFLSYPIPTDNMDSGALVYGWGLAANFNFDLFKEK